MNFGFLCALDWEDTLKRELETDFLASSVISPAPGLISCDDQAVFRERSPIFARQWLPNLQEVQGTSIKDLVKNLGPKVDAILDSTPSTWNLQVHTPDLFTESGEKYKFMAGRAEMIKSAFLERMRTYRRRTMERFLPEGENPAFANHILIQLVPTSPSQLWLSDTLFFQCENQAANQSADQADDSRFKSVPSEAGTFLRGMAPLPFSLRNGPGLVVHDPQAPCRSYYKIKEVWLQAGFGPKRQSTCVDLGAAPGGWTWAALQRGARVIAIDAGDLKNHVATHPECQHSRDNGYAFLPDNTVDWMFCDMIVRPMATLGLLDRWLSAGLCRNFVVNVKFRGKDPTDIVKTIRDMAQRFSLTKLLIRHLYHDRNEITLIGSTL